MQFSWSFFFFNTNRLIVQTWLYVCTVGREPDLANRHHKYLSTNLLEAPLAMLLVSAGGTFLAKESSPTLNHSPLFSLFAPLNYALSYYFEKQKWLFSINFWSCSDQYLCILCIFSKMGSQRIYSHILQGIIWRVNQSQNQSEYWTLVHQVTKNSTAIDCIYILDI